MFIAIRNEGPKVASTNYWETEQCGRGFIYLSWNAGAARLLVPESQEGSIPDMKTGRHVVISRGPVTQFGGRQGLEMLFDDGSDEPYAIFIMVEQCDRLLPPSDIGRKFPFDIYTRQGLVHSMDGHYRTVKRIPWLKPFATL